MTLFVLLVGTYDEENEKDGEMDGWKATIMRARMATDTNTHAQKEK